MLSCVFVCTSGGLAWLQHTNPFICPMVYRNEAVSWFFFHKTFLWFVSHCKDWTQLWGWELRIKAKLNSVTIYPHRVLLRNHLRGQRGMESIGDRGKHCWHGWTRALNRNELTCTQGPDKHDLCVWLKICRARCQFDYRINCCMIYRSNRKRGGKEE